MRQQLWDPPGELMGCSTRWAPHQKQARCCSCALGTRHRCCTARGSSMPVPLLCPWWDTGTTALGQSWERTRQLLHGLQPPIRRGQVPPARDGKGSLLLLSSTCDT